MGFLEEIQKKLEEAARQAQGGGMSVDTNGGGNGDDIPNPWPQNQTTQTQQVPNIPTQPAPQPQQQTTNQQQYQQQYNQLVQQLQQTAQQIFQLGYQYGVQTAQGVIRSGLMDNPEGEK